MLYLGRMGFAATVAAVMKARRLRIAAGWLAGAALGLGLGGATGARAAVQVAGSLLVSLDARDASAGTATWVNAGTIGNFSRVGTPAKQTVGGQAAVTFNGTNQAYRSVNVTTASLEGHSSRSIEVWAYNPSLESTQGEEPMVTWGKRGTALANVSFNYGGNAGWGAVTQYGGDLGWGIVPAVGQWHYLVYTYDGTMTRVYDNTQMLNSGSFTLVTAAGNHINLAAENGSSGSLIFVNEFNSNPMALSGSIAIVRVHTGALSQAQINNNFSEDATRFGASAPPPPPVEHALANSYFNILVDSASGGLMTLQRTNDTSPTDYLMGRITHPAFSVDDSRWTGDVVTQYRFPGDANWRSATTGLSDDTRAIDIPTSTLCTVDYLTPSAKSGGIRDYTLHEQYELQGDAFLWTLQFTNTNATTMTLGDLALPLMFNRYWPPSQTDIYTLRVFEHTFFANDGSYIVAERLNGIGPELVITPQPGTQLEHFTRQRSGSPFGASGSTWSGLYTAFVYSAATGGPSHLPHTSTTIGPGETRTFGFTLRWAADDQDVARVLYQNGMIATTVVPGMSVPTDLTAKMDLYTSQTITAVSADFTTETQITTGTQTADGHHLYTLHFAHLGANTVTVSYGAGRKMPLQFFAMEPLEGLIQHRAAFIADNQQEPSSSVGWYHAILMWDMNTRQRPTNQSWGYAVQGSDDPGFADPIFLSEKEVHAPVQAEIDVLEDYLRDFIWGDLQLHDGESPGPDWGIRDAWNSTWTTRSYDFPHLFNIYYNMYRVSKLYGMTHYLTADEYLQRAYNTAHAFFTISGGNGTFGNMGEFGLVPLMQALTDEGHTTEAQDLATRWAAKATAFDATPYPFGSEITQDSTGFDTAYALGKWAGLPNLIDKAIKANLSNRGKQPLWYYYSTDLRNMGEVFWNISYMTQLGAWALQDYALNYSPQPAVDMRLAYGGYLAGYSTINSGYYSSDPANLYSSAWVYQSELGASDWASDQPLMNGTGGWAWTGESGLGYFGGLRMAASVVTMDPIFGLTGYGCDVTTSTDGLLVTPRDGIRERLYLTTLGASLLLDRDALEIVDFAGSGRQCRLTVDNRTGDAHTTNLTLRGLAAGHYGLFSGATELSEFDADGVSDTAIPLAMTAGGSTDFVIRAPGILRTLRWTPYR